jgi:hypothetical protein
VQHWLLVRGGGSRPLPAAVDVARLDSHRSTRRPALQPGDRALLYAAVWQSIFATAEVSGPPEHESARARWGWRIPLRPVTAIADLDDAPPVQAAGVFPLSLGRHSYIRLTPEQFEAGVEALADAGASNRVLLGFSRGRPRPTD